MKQNILDFLEREYRTQYNKYIKLVGVKALTLKEGGEIFVGRYLGFKDGFVLFKVRASDKLPRKSSFWTASYLCGDMARYKNWGDLSWAELRAKYQGDYCEVFCAWLSKMNDDPDFYIVGFKGFNSEFVQEKLIPNNPIIAFGPKDPPLEYLANLNELVSQKLSALEEETLNCYVDNKEQAWLPIRITHSENLTNLLQKALTSSDIVAIQGPPGTGKTYRMAQFISTLLVENKSVLATSLTNEALKVLATKEALSSALDAGKINKTSLSTDEQKEVPKLESNEGNECNPRKGYLSLSTFYISSRWATQAMEVTPFDYVIVDEASQAYLPMLVASLRLGKKVVWIGDQNQLAPIVQTNEDIIKNKGWKPIIKGFDTVCKYLKIPAFMLGDTFRLTARGAGFTSVFYSAPLCSVSTHQQVNVSDNRFIPSEGGPALIELSLKHGDKIPECALVRIEEVVGQILSINPKAEIAILAKFKETIQALQKHFAPQENKGSMLKIETVDRIQGMTVDYTIFLIPNTSVERSLEKEFFNVATSRARYATIIIADKGIMNENMPEEVRCFFFKLYEGMPVAFTPKETTSSLLEGIP